jgi:hypothetical protein
LGDEVVAAQYREFKGFMVPVAMHFERVFGREWGPESLRFDNVRVSR